MDRRNLKKLSAELSNYLVSGVSRFQQPRPEHRFIHWFICAQFGEDVKTHLTDGTGDGGIDAIVYDNNEAIVLQSKYERTAKLGTVTRDQVAGLEQIKDRLLAKDPSNFNEWINTVRAELIPLYRELRQRIQRRTKARFIFVTTRLSHLAGSTVGIVDIKNISPLWVLYKEGFTPPVERITLNFRQSMELAGNARSEFRTLVGLAKASDFTKLLLDRRNERLFAQNVRTDLDSKLNKEILSTFENEPQTFWLGNNGIYLVCKKFEQSKDSQSRFILTFPSIINGSQTIHTIAKARRTRFDRSLLVRVLEMDVHRDPGLLSQVIRRTNRQNPMNGINLCAHDPVQLNIARFLLKHAIFYERREKEWRNEKRTDSVFKTFSPVTVKEVGQWLASCNWNIGPGKARSRTGAMFDSDYNDIFGAFEDNDNERDYARLLTIVFAGLYVRSALKTISSKRSAQARIMTLVFVRIVAEVLRSSRKQREKLACIVREGRYIGAQIPARASRQLSGIVSDFEAIQRSAARKDRTLDFSNFFKRDKLIKRAYSTVITRDVRRQLANELLA